MLEGQLADVGGGWNLQWTQWCWIELLNTCLVAHRLLVENGLCQIRF